MAHRYQLDLATMLTVLADHTGRLSTTGILFPGTDSPCEVVVSVGAGQVQECRVISWEQGVFMGDEVLQAVLALGVLCWTYTPDLPLTSAPAVLDLAPLVPQRVREVPLRELGAWPRLPRVLYQLTDGKRTIAHLTHLLSQQQTQIVASLMVLEQRGVIRLGSNTPSAREQT